MIESLTLLVIDDSEDDRLLYRRAMEKNTSIDYTLIETNDGESGFLAVEKAQPDCILLDYSMPGYDGIEILKRIRSRYPFVPVVMLTGHGNEKIAVNAMQEGAQNYIAKSIITTDTLEHVIRMAIDHCQLEKRIYDQRTSLEIFTRALAHDLKEPVRTIRSFSQLILQNEHFSNPTTAGYFNHILNAATRMQMLIETVFNYTRLDDPERVARANHKVTTILLEVKENLTHLIAEHKAVITCGKLPEIHANKMQVLQIFQNLICNSINHSDHPVIVHISATEQEKDWLFRVTDNGPGINPVYLLRIFEPFKRLVQNEEGAGLGLSICQKIVESHHGRIWCESQLGSGTSFLFTMPKAIPENAKQGTIVARETLTGIRQDRKILANVLLVDDRKADLDLIRINLIEQTKLQCNLFIAQGGEEALKHLENGTSIDLMLVDINMPQMDGFELVASIHEQQRKNIAIVMCTGSTYDRDMERAESLGAIGYLLKPGDFMAFKAIVEQKTSLKLCQEDEGYVLLRAA